MKTTTTTTMHELYEYFYKYLDTKFPYNYVPASFYEEYYNAEVVAEVVKETKNKRTQRLKTRVFKDFKIEDIRKHSSGITKKVLYIPTGEVVLEEMNGNYVMIRFMYWFYTEYSK